MSWLDKLKFGMKKTASILSFKSVNTEDLEDALISADVGWSMTQQLIACVREQSPKDGQALRELLVNAIRDKMASVAVPLTIDSSHKPFVVLMTGVNGAGKTTTIGKLAQFYKNLGLRVSVVAADTFRAGATEQLEQWAGRSGCPVYKTAPGADAAGLVYDALIQSRQAGDDILFVDTAGRLHNRTDLMDELKKIRRVIQKVDPTAPHACLLVLDATVGQNAIQQVKAFQEIVDVTGLVMTKLDGTAKGGILVALADAFNLPIHAVGLGEGVDDLRAFTAQEYADSLIGDAV